METRPDRRLSVDRALLDDLLQRRTRLKVPASVGGAEGRGELLRQALLQDVEIPLALNHVVHVLLVEGEQVTRHVQGGVEGDGDSAVEADRWIKHAVEVAEGDATLRLVVDEEAQRVRGIEVKEHADGRALLHAALRPLRVAATVHEP